MESSPKYARAGEGAEEPPLRLPEPMLRIIEPTPGTTPEITTPNVPDATAGASGLNDAILKLAPVDMTAVGSSPIGERPSLQRNSSSFSTFKNTFSTHMGRLSLNRSREASPERIRRRRSSNLLTKSRSKSNSNSAVHSPEIQAMIKREVIPDLEAVNSALEAVNNSPDDSDGEKTTCVRQLSALTADLETAHKDGKKLLNEAMQARSVDHPEICRSKCLQIIHSPYAEVDTKIYAFNILATQASIGHAERYLDESTALVHQHVKEEGERFQLLGVISVLRESARERVRLAARCAGKTLREEAEANEPRENWYHNEYQRWRWNVTDESQMHMELPRSAGMAADVKATPKIERSLKWAERGEEAKE